LASPGEPADVVIQYAEIFKSGDKIGEVETYHSMFPRVDGCESEPSEPGERQRIRTRVRIENMFLISSHSVLVLMI
jgi:hypothetical protein